jgi:large subunit ribosomal protein L9
MKVIFLQDVPGVAKSGESKEVASGYARNYLLPKRIAAPADVQALSVAEAQRRSKARRQAETTAELKDLANELNGKEFTIKARAGAKDQIYGAVTNADIAAELEKSAGLVVDRRKIALAAPIHSLGSYEVTIRLAKDIVPTIKVTVVGEGEKKES